MKDAIKGWNTELNLEFLKKNQKTLCKIFSKSMFITKIIYAEFYSAFYL